MDETPAARPDSGKKPAAPEAGGVPEEKPARKQGGEAAPGATMLTHQQSAEMNDFPEDMTSKAQSRLNRSLTDEELRNAKAKMSESSGSIQESQDLAVSGQILAKLSWSFANASGADDTDLDISAVVFDIEGVVLDACYYNQKWVLDGALRHSGDDRFGAFVAEENKDEVRTKQNGEAVKVMLSSLPAEAVVIFFVVNCFRGGKLKDIENSRATFSVKDGATLMDIDLSTDTDLEDEPGLILAMLYRSRKNPPAWMFRETAAPVDAYNFTRAIETMRIMAQRSRIISDVLVAPILNGRKVFHMRKGDYAKLPSGVRYISVGLGWQTRGRGELDLDTAAVVSVRTKSVCLFPEAPEQCAA
uniref:TerD domain-containing protein n=1 Tax=Pinguiococcus pyrenoidosus TaxID=172671 RepID=A0A7R9UFI9_9STRA|mmetsp:Transcript_8489/g.31972  ORF Transcript_8489/g.31972 Transcript_8489/m.31972 type:complete len:359 (+) Transcript_8489:232-1308(+)|eukprot:scaffold1785_cov247-Pinguiococcus_pyrenoidosus.AAC.17